jgi:hypothetical protein
MKHVGKMKNNNAKVVVVYRTLPGDAYSAVVVGTSGLQESYHDSLMSLIQVQGQDANELADILSVRKFPDGNNMLEFLHTRGYLKKVPTDGVLMTPTPTDSISLDELNQLIAQQKGVSVDELAITDGVNPNPKTKKENDPTNKEEPVSNFENSITINESSNPVTATELRSFADKLFKEAQALRRKADELEPPVKKTAKTVKAEA